MCDLTNLPVEILHETLKKLDSEDIMSVGKTCRYLFSACIPIWKSKISIEATRDSNLLSYRPLQNGVSILTLSKLAVNKHLRSLTNLTIDDIEDCNDPNELSALVRCVTGSLRIHDTVRNLKPILGSLKCKVLYISEMTLDAADITSMLNAMNSGLRCLRVLSAYGIHKVLKAYNGQGECETIIILELSEKTVTRLVVEQWTKKVGWVLHDHSPFCIFYRPCVIANTIKYMLI